MNSKINLIHSVLFGKKEKDSKIYTFNNIKDNDILNYRLTKIKCQIKSNEGIYGIQIIYQNLISLEEDTLINIKSDLPDLIEQEMTFNYEQILDIKFWLNDDIKLIGFEVITSKGRFKKFGYGKDDQLRLCHELTNKERAVVKFTFFEKEKNGITGMTLYHMDKKTHAFYIYRGIFGLRSKLKNGKNKNDIEKKFTEDKMTEAKNKLLFNICCLPDNQFFNVIKYAIN